MTGRPPRDTDPEQTLAIVAGVRTPFCRSGGELQQAAAQDLAAHAIRELFVRCDYPREQIDEVILGCAGPQATEANVARVAALRAGLPQAIPAVTVMRNCASGLEALVAADRRLRAGDGDVFVVGGVESMSSFPLVMGAELTAMFARLGKAKSLAQRLRALASFRPRQLKPRVAILEGLTDPTSGLMMGHTAENVARQFGIHRDAQDQFALASHQRAARARESGRLGREIAPICPPPRFRALVSEDDGIRSDSSLAALARLRPVFDRREGDVTVGNACQVTDGAVALLVMREARARAAGIRPLALVRGVGVAGLDPRVMGLGPVHATPRALADAGLEFAALEQFEINEAFAAQVLACLDALASDTFAREELGRTRAVGALPPDRLNVNGGAIALGHPIGATGARIVTTLVHELARSGERYGVASLCVGGGQGSAVVLERST